MTTPNHGPSSHNLPPTVGPDYIEGLPGAVQMDKIDAFRSAQEAHIVNAINGVADYADRMTKRAEAIADFEDMAADFLKAEGIDETDPKFDEFKALLLRYAITEDGFSPREWEEHKIDPSTGDVLPSERDKVVDALRVEYPDSLLTPPTPPTTPPATPTTTAPTAPIPKTTAEIKAIVDAVPEIITARAKVNVLREELAELSAKRQRRLFTRSKNLYEFDDKVDQYEEAVNELAKAELKAEKDAGKERDETEERFAAALKLVDNYRQLQESSIDKLKNTKVSGFIRMMTSGSTPVRMLKGLGLGVGVGLVAGALTAVTGGAAAAGAATAVVAAGRFARSYARFDNENNRGVRVADASLDTEVVDKSGATGKDSDETIDLVNKYLLKQLEEDMLTEQGKRRKATAKAMGMVVVGSLAGEALHFGHDVYASHSAHDVDGSKPGIDGDSDKPGAGVDKPDVPAVTTPDYLDEAGAHAMSNGEGLYQTFHDMGIPQKDWSTLLEQSGPKLHDIQVDGHPLAYQMPNGEWGLRMTADGTFPQQGLDVISNTHDHMTGVSASDATDHAAEAAPHNSPVETDTSAADTSGADADMLTSVPIDHSMIDGVLDKPVVNPSDITGNPSLSQLTHVIPQSHADYLADKLNLRPTEWQPVEDYIAHQTTQGKPLYGDVFNVTTNGVVEFKTNTVPPATMADIITHIPTSVRSRL